MAGCFRIAALLLPTGVGADEDVETEEEEDEIDMGGLVGIEPLGGTLVGQCVGCARGLRGEAGVASDRGDWG